MPYAGTFGVVVDKPWGRTSKTYSAIYVPSSGQVIAVRIDQIEKA